MCIRDRPYSHGLSSLANEDCFKEEVMRQSAKMKQMFGKAPKVFRNSSLIYNDEIGAMVASMGFKGMLTEGAKHVLGWKSPHYVYLSLIHILTNFKIVSAIRNEIASRLDIDSFQEVLASHWKPYLDNLHVCMTDATCYESHMRFPTDMKLLWESLEWLYRHICRHCRELGIRRPRNKYRNVAESYLSYCKKRKRRASRTRMLKRRMIKLLEKLLSQRDGIHSEYGALLRYTQDYHKRLSTIRKVLVQELSLIHI